MGPRIPAFRLRLGTIEIAQDGQRSLLWTGRNLSHQRRYDPSANLDERTQFLRLLPKTGQQKLGIALFAWTSLQTQNVHGTGSFMRYLSLVRSLHVHRHLLPDIKVL